MIRVTRGVLDQAAGRQSVWPRLVAVVHASSQRVYRPTTAADDSVNGAKPKSPALINAANARSGNAGRCATFPPSPAQRPSQCDPAHSPDTLIQKRFARLLQRRDDAPRFDFPSGPRRRLEHRTSVAPHSRTGGITESWRATGTDRATRFTPAFLHARCMIPANTKPRNTTGSMADLETWPGLFGNG
jgi:hypothetical protein